MVCGAIPQPLVGSTRLGFCGFFPRLVCPYTLSLRNLNLLATLSMETGRSKEEVHLQLYNRQRTVGSWGLHEVLSQWVIEVFSASTQLDAVSRPFTALSLSLSGVVFLGCLDRVLSQSTWAHLMSGSVVGSLGSA